LNAPSYVQLSLKGVSEAKMTKHEEQYLMAIGMHAPEEGRPAGLLNIDLAFAQIISRDEKGGFGTIRRKYVKEMRRIVIWTIVKGQGYCATLPTMRNSLSFVRDIAD
jgi:hypothetical protein